MAEGEDQEKGDPKRGFAGLSSMVSDVDTKVPQTACESRAASRGAPAPAPAERARSTEDQGPDRPVWQAPESSSAGSSTGMWLLGIGAVVGLLWLVSQSGDKTSSPAPVFTPSDDSSSVASPSPSSQPAPSPVSALTRPSEEKPPVGTNSVLTSAQLRYCVAEEIRLGGAKGVINNYNDTHVDRFNAMVADYNGRCGQFRYRRGALEGARAEVEHFRAGLAADGRARFVRGTAAPSQERTFVPVEPSPDPTVKTAQQLLNELGYDAGPADGVMGNRTRSAIVAFQEAGGSSATAVADWSLLLQLQQALLATRKASGAALNMPSDSLSTERTPSNAPSAGNPRSGIPANAWAQGSNWYCNDGYRKVGDGCEKVNVPANAWVQGANWYCNDGYRRVGEGCKRLNVPLNAWVQGSNWYCNDGYRKVGDSCDKLNVPANAWVQGSNWYCNDGYRRVGESCERLKVPAHAWVQGSNWYCNDGYRRVGESCERLNVPPNAWVQGSNWYCNDGYKRVGDKCESIFEKSR